MNVRALGLALTLAVDAVLGTASAGAAVQSYRVDIVNTAVSAGSDPADGALFTPDGSPGARAEFSAIGGYRVVSGLASSETVVAEGTLSVASVSESATLALFGLGLAGIGCSRRRARLTVATPAFESRG